MENLEYFFNVVDTRKTNRNYDKYIPPKDDIERIINSARLAPSAVNVQNWKFIAIYNKDIKHKMANAVLETYDEILGRLNNEETKEKVSRFKGHSTFFENAPVAIVCVMQKAPSFLEGVLEDANYSEDEISRMRPNSQLLSMGGAIENMALPAHALGLGSCWMVAPVLAEKKFNEILNLSQDEKVISILTVGKPLDTDNRSPKKQLNEVMEVIE